MKTIIAIVLILVVGSISMCDYSVYKLIADIPEEAQVENLNRRYAELIEKLDHAIQSSESVLSLAALLEKIEYPEDTIYVEMAYIGKDSEDSEAKSIVVIDQIRARGNKFRAIVNGGGYGRTGNENYLILQHPLKKYEFEHIELRFKRDALPG